MTTYASFNGVRRLRCGENLIIYGDLINPEADSGAESLILILEQSGVMRWRVKLFEVGVDPTSAHNSSSCRDFQVAFYREQLLLVAGSSRVVMIRLDTGQIQGEVPFQHTGKDSLDFLEVVPVPLHGVVLVQTARSLISINESCRELWRLESAYLFEAPLQLEDGRVIVRARDLSSLALDSANKHFDLDTGAACD